MRFTSQQQQCLDMFRANDYHVTTGMFLKTTLSAEYRKIISELRKLGFEIPAPRLNRSQPGLNLYTLIEGQAAPEKKTPVTQVNDLSENSPDKCYNRLPNGDICGSYFRRGKECNICQK